MPRAILTVNIAWNSNQWKCPNINDFYNRNNYGFQFVRTVGFGYEWWNFDDVPNGNYYWDNVKQINTTKLPHNPDNWYYGYFENKEKLPQNFINKHPYQPNNLNNGGIIVFISRNIYDEKFYFVGLYYDAFFLHDGSRSYYICDDIDNLCDCLLYAIVKNMQTNNTDNPMFNQYNNCPNNPNHKIIRNIIGKKELSFVLDNPVPITPGNINIEGFGQAPFSYGLDRNPRLLVDLLCKALISNTHSLILVNKITKILSTYDPYNNVFRQS